MASAHLHPSESILFWVRQRGSRKQNRQGRTCNLNLSFKTKKLYFLIGPLNLKKKKSNPLTWSFTFNLHPLRIKIIGSCYLLLSMTRRYSVCEEKEFTTMWVLHHRQTRTALPQAYTHTVSSCLFPTSSSF